MDAADRPVRKFQGKGEETPFVGTLRSLFVAVSLKWIQGGRDFLQGGKERKGPIVKGGSLSGCLINTRDLFLRASP